MTAADTTPATEQPTVVLHLSDVHRTPDEPATNSQILISLTDDFSRYAGEAIPAPHLVVASGDLTQSAESTEYDDAAALFDQVLKTLQLTQHRLVIVPGNHDVHWPTYRQSLHPVEQDDIKVGGDLVRNKGAITLAPNSERDYAKRLNEFRRFYEKATGATFPIERSESFVVHDFPELPVHVCFAALSSIDTNDQYNSQGKIHPDAIHAAAQAMNRSARFKLAVWHHDANWQMTRGEDFLTLQSLQFIAQAGFHMGLCGHTHRPGKHELVVQRDQNFPSVNAGTVCAGARERSESIPRSYNIIEIHEDGRVRVHVRVKDDLSSPWRDHAIFGQPGARRAWYEFQLSTGDVGSLPDESPPTSSPPPTAPTSNGTIGALLTGPASSPFREYDARAQAPEEVVQQYVWLETSSRTDSDQPQVVVGTRGSGKTSLLATLTPVGRFHHRENFTSPPLRRLAFVFPLRVHQISGLGGRGWIPSDERADLFRAILGAGMARAFVDCIEDTVRLFGDEIVLPSLGEACGAIGPAWFPRIPDAWSIQALRDKINELNRRAVGLHSDRNSVRRRDGVAALTRETICASGTQFVVAAADALASFPAFSDTHWIAAFDEAEFLNERQQALLYELLSQKTPRVTVKIATLPYAHSRAIQNLHRPLVPGDDYEEVAISLSHNRLASTKPPSTADDDDDIAARAFETIATQIWKRRLRPHYDTVPELASVFPDVPHEEVVSEVRGRKTSASELQLELLGHLSPKRQASARGKTHGELSSQFLRKYQRPFRFRMAKRDARRIKVKHPLYWGLSDLMRACDGNCRSFLQILELCWRRYWAKTGFRSLTPAEQHEAITAWAWSVRRKARAFGERGAVLDRILDNLANAFRQKLHRGYMTYETLRWTPSRKLTDEQLEAVLVGIAYGLLSPKLDTGNGGYVAYPSDKEIAVRLGFPVAVAGELPLRSGAEMSVDVNRMIQLGFPGWE